MTNKQAGGPAFPCDLAAYDPEVRKDMQGMELRDYFAAKALQGMLANAGPYDPKWAKDSPDYKHAQSLAALCYFFADEMLEARNGQT